MKLSNYPYIVFRDGNVHRMSDNYRQIPEKQGQTEGPMESAMKKKQEDRWRLPFSFPETKLYDSREKL